MNESNWFHDLFIQEAKAALNNSDNGSSGGSAPLIVTSINDNPSVSFENALAAYNAGQTVRVVGTVNSTEFDVHKYKDGSGDALTGHYMTVSGSTIEIHVLMWTSSKFEYYSNAELTADGSSDEYIPL